MNEAETEEPKSKHGTIKTPEQPGSSSAIIKDKSNGQTNSASRPGVPGSPSSPDRILMLEASIEDDADIQRQLQTRAYKPPWEHTPPPQATFTIELDSPNKQAEEGNGAHEKCNKIS